ncbi:MAG TPA: prolyl oligopeptidase family serine peptidase [Candidatus Nanopelagicales bacterium]
MAEVASYGSWSSPVTAAFLVAGAASVTDVQVAGTTTWWSEARPSEGGREQVVRLEPGGEPVDVLPEGWSARTRVHEYGGGAWWVAGGSLFFVAWDDQRLYRLDPGGEPVPLTPEPASQHALRYADGGLTPDGRWVVCVRERHPADGSEAVNEVVGVRAESPAGGPHEPVVLVGGRDFVAAPRISRDGRQLAWLAWDHPDMPWDGSELWVGRLVEGPAGLALDGARREAGGREESLVEPIWGRHASLFVVSDRTDWWNVHRVDGVDRLTPVHTVPAEVGGPSWVFGMAHVGVDRDGAVVATYTDEGRAQLLVLPESGELRVTPLPAVSLQQLRVAEGVVTAIAVLDDSEPAVVRFPLADPAAFEVLRAPRRLDLPDGLTGPGEHLTYPSEGRLAHAWFHAPRNPAFTAPRGELPPLLVRTHGGPTGSVRPGFDLTRLFWTSRGFAVVDVDYGGSTGYGRAYRQLLRGAWGVVDVEDCVNAARHLVAEGRVDGSRLIIQGGSAGGFTTLAVLSGYDDFAAGGNLFGVADLVTFVGDTHKFESRYLEGLVGPWPAARERYEARSPINHLDGFRTPLIVLQGLEDAVVPPSQSEAIVAALDTRGIPVAYLAFEGEQHGFRRSESIVRVSEASLAFYRRVLGLPDPEHLPPVEIRHADALPPVEPHGAGRLPPGG